MEKQLNDAFKAVNGNKKKPSIMGGLWRGLQYIISGIAYLFGGIHTQLVRLDANIPEPTSPKNQMRGWYEYELNNYNEEIEKLTKYIDNQQAKLDQDIQDGRLKKAEQRSDRIKEAKYDRGRQEAAMLVIKGKLYKHTK